MGHPGVDADSWFTTNLENGRLYFLSGILDSCILFRVYNYFDTGAIISFDSYIFLTSNKIYIMREETIGKHKVKIYDSIDELPIIRFHKYNKYMLIDSGVGSDLEDADGRFVRAMKFIKSDPELAIKELQNLRQLLHLISETINPTHLAFATLVAEIDGEPRTDLSDTGLSEVIRILGEAKKGWIDWLLELVKKKIDTELTLYFPGMFDDAGSKEFYDRLRARTLTILDGILTGDDKTEEIGKIDDYLLSLAKPKSFSGKDSVEIQYDKQFESMNILLAHQLSVNTNNMTVLQYYNAFEYLKKSVKNKKNG